MATVAELFSRLGLDVDEGGFNLASALIGGVQSGLKALGATGLAAGAAVAGMVGITVATGSELKDLSAQTGVSSDALQRLHYIAGQVGVSAESLTTALAQIAKNAAGAGEDGGEMADAFRKLGINVKGANGQLKAADTLFSEAHARISEIQNPTERTAIAMKVFGRSGKDLGALLAMSGTEVESLQRRFELLGGAMTKDTIDKADELGDRMFDVKTAMAGVAYTIAGPLLEPLTELANAFAEWIAANRELISQKVHGVLELVGRAAKVAWGLARPFVALLEKLLSTTWFLKAAMIAFGLVLAVQAGQALQAFASSVAGLVAKMVGLAGAQGVSTALAWAWSLAWVAGVLLILLVLEDLYQFFTGGESVFGDFVEGPLTAFQEAFVGTIDEIGRSISSMWEGMMNAASAAFDWVLQKAKEVGAGILQAFPGGQVAAEYWFGKGAAQSATAQVTSAMVNPGAAAAGAVANMFNAPITVNALPGQDPKEIASEARRQFDEWHAAKVAEAAVGVNQ